MSLICLQQDAMPSPPVPPQDLPNVPYVTLTEAITYIVYGAPLSRKDLQKRFEDWRGKNMRQWINSDGPNRLLEYFPDPGVGSTAHKKRPGFVEQWLWEKRGFSLDSIAHL